MPQRIHLVTHLVAGVAALVLMTAWPAAAVAQTGPEGSVRVTVPRANVRSEPSLSGRILTQVVRGDILPVEAEVDGWYRVRVSMSGIRFEAFISGTVCERFEAEAAGAPVDPAAMTGTTTGPAEIRDGMSVSYLEMRGGSLGITPVAVTPVMVPGDEDSLLRLTGRLPAPSQQAAGAAEAADIEADADVVWVWVAPREAAVPALGDAQPRFIVSFAAVPGVPADALTATFVRLTPATDGRRIIGAALGHADQARRTDDDWDVMAALRQEAVPTIVVDLEPGTLNIQPREELAAGEYAIVIRPKDDDALSGVAVLSGQGVGAVFSVAWLFRVGPSH